MLGEAALVTVLLGAGMAVQLVLSRGLSLFRRHLWIDEIVTFKLVSDRDVSHALRAIVGGLDTNPPCYHLLLRLLRRLVGSAAEVLLRLFALLCVLLALGGLYVSLRQAFPPPVSLAGVLAVWAHPLILVHAFEARMYAPWFAATVWFGHALALSGEASADIWLQVLLAGTALLTCTLHTLGTIALGLVVSFHLLARPAETWHWSVLAPVSLGPLAFLAWIPFLWKQNGTNPVTWVSAPSKSTVVRFLGLVLFPSHLVPFLLGGGLMALVWWLGGRSVGPGVFPPNPAVLVGLAGLGLMPLVLVVLSYAAQPLLVDHYAMPVVACFGPAAALAVSPVSGFWLCALCGLLGLISAYGLHKLAATYRYRDRRNAELIAAIRRHATGGPVLFESPLELYVVCHYAPELAERCFALDFEPGQLSHIDAFRLSVRNLARIFARYYPPPTPFPWETACDLPQKYLVPLTEARPRGLLDPQRRYPGFCVRPIEAGLYQLVARSSAPPASFR
jgi:hypothetical protein